MRNVIKIENLTVKLRQRKGERILVDRASFSVDEGRCLGILGESGSGKSMTVKAVLGLLDRNFVVSGSAQFQGKDLIQEKKETLREIRGNKVAMVLQNPMTCFDPLYRVGKQMEETFATHTDWSGEKIHRESLEILGKMRIHDGEEVLQKYPHQLSGGMLQRIMIGIAMALKPALLIADEPTTAIDSITQAEILEEFRKIKEQHNTAMIFISHDLGAVSSIADEILVMNSGKIVDRGDFAHILNHAEDPYTRLLVEKRRDVMEQYRNMIHGYKGRKEGVTC